MSSSSRTWWCFYRWGPLRPPPSFWSVNLCYKYELNLLRIGLASFWVGIVLLDGQATCNLLWMFPDPFVFFSNSGDRLDLNVFTCEKFATLLVVAAANVTECVKETLLNTQFGGFSAPFVMYTVINGNNLFASYIVYFTWP